MIKELFKQNAARSEYLKLVRAYRAKPAKSGEWHHIVPRSLGGDDTDYNLVYVPCRVHFRLHELLIDMCRTSEHKRKMSYALWRMATPGKNTSGRKVTAAQYAKAKSLLSLYLRGDLNPMKNPEVAAKCRRNSAHQSEVAKAVNAKRWAREDRKYACSYCGHTETKSEPIASAKKEGWCCSISCYYWFKNPEAEDRYYKRQAAKLAPRTSSMKGRPNPTAAESGRKGAETLSKTVTGRRMATRPDGTRYWVYPGELQR